MLGRVERIFCFVLTVLFCSCATTKPDLADLSSSEADLNDVEKKDAREPEVSPESSGKQNEPEELLTPQESDDPLGESPEEGLKVDNQTTKNDREEDSQSNDSKDALSPDATSPEKISAEDGSSHLDSSTSSPAGNENPDSSLPSDQPTVRSVESREPEPVGDDGLKPHPIPSGETPSLSTEAPSAENDPGSNGEASISKTSGIPSTPEVDSPTEPSALGDSPKAPAVSESDAGSENSDDSILDPIPEAPADKDSGKNGLPPGSALSKENEGGIDSDSGATSQELGLSGEDSTTSPEGQLPEGTNEPFVGSAPPERDSSPIGDRDRFRFSSPRSFIRRSVGRSEEDGLNLGFSSRRQNLQAESGSADTRRYLHLNDWIGKASGRDSSKEDLYLGSSEPTEEPQLKTYIDESPLVGISEPVPWEYDAIAEVLKSRDAPAGKSFNKDYDYDSLRKLFSSESSFSSKNRDPALDRSDSRDYESLLRWLDSRKGLSRPQGSRELPKRKYSSVLRWLKNEGRKD